MKHKVTGTLVGPRKKSMIFNSGKSLVWFETTDLRKIKAPECFLGVYERDWVKTLVLFEKTQAGTRTPTPWMRGNAL